MPDTDSANSNHNQAVPRPNVRNAIAVCRKHAAEALDHFTPDNVDRVDIRLVLVGMSAGYQCSCGRKAAFYLRELVGR